SSAGAAGVSRRRSGATREKTNRVFAAVVIRTVPDWRATARAANGPIGNGPLCFGSPVFGRGVRSTAVVAQSAALLPAGRSTFHTGLPASAGLVIAGESTAPGSPLAATRSTVTTASALAANRHIRAAPRGRNRAVVST